MSCLNEYSKGLYIKYVLLIMSPLYLPKHLRKYTYRIYENILHTKIEQISKIERTRMDVHECYWTNKYLCLFMNLPF